MSRDFRYKDFVNRLRFQVGGICPSEFSEDGEKYIKGFVYSESLYFAKILYKTPEVDAVCCEAITQVIAEWTFHKIIDLMNGEIPDEFHSIVLKKVNKAIYDFMIDQNKMSPFDYSVMDNVELLEKIKKIVNNSYRDALGQIFADKAIDRATYQYALEQCSIEDFSKRISEIESSEKNDKFFASQEAFDKNKKFTFKRFFMHAPFHFVNYLIVIPMLILCLGKAGYNNWGFCNGVMILLFLVILEFANFIIETMLEIYPYKQETEVIECEEDFSNPNYMYEHLGVDVISVKIGEGLVKYFDPELKNLILPKIAKLRKSMTDNLGYIIPKVRIFDDKDVDKYNFEIYIRDVKRVQYTLDVTKNDFTDVFISHLKACCIKYVANILSKGDVLKLMEIVRSQDPTLVNDLIPELISAIDFRRIIIYLIREEISIKDIILIFERLCDFARYNKEPDVLAARLRVELAPQICAKYSTWVDDKNILYALTLSNDFENQLKSSVCRSELGIILKLSSEQVETLINGISNTWKSLPENCENPVIIVNTELRQALFELLVGYFPDVRVMAYSELIPEVTLVEIAQIS